jgi:hypothetical protein
MDATDGMTTQDAEKPGRGPVYFWLGEIAAAKKREKDFRKDGNEVLDIYNGKKVDSIPFNILYSNTETLLPALYNNTPRPQVTRRFRDEDPLGKAAAKVGERTLSFLLDTNSDEYAAFDDVMGDGVLDGLLPGRGQTRAKYDFESGTVGETEIVTWETVCFESLKWDRWVHGYAKTWKRVPWIALEHDITEKEAKRLFGAAMAAKIKFEAGQDQEPEEKSDVKRDETSQEQSPRTAKVWEIWDKYGGRKVRFIAESYKEGYLKVIDDPLELTGFYPFPKPLMFQRKSNDLTPTALYQLYKNQAKELNRITTRINRVVEAIKVRGVYDSTLKEDLEQLLKKDDNVMVGAENVASLQNGGLDKAIWLMPIEKLVVVVQQLFLAREACKKVIYEITGISDILRGQTAASETLGAQEIKEGWATLRLKRMQKEVQRYVRDVLRITLEIAVKKFKVDTFKQMTGLQYPTAMQKQAAQGLLARAQSAQAMGQPPGNPEELQMAQQALALPSWEQILEALRNDQQRQYQIDIETNSTVDLEATEDQKNLAEVLNAVAQFLNGVGPLVEQGTLPFDAAKSMLLGIVRKYRFGDEIEDQIQKMQAPQGKSDPAVEKAQVQMEVEKQKAAHEKELMQLELEIKKEELRLKRDELKMKAEYQALMGRLKMQEGQNKLAQAVAMSQVPAQPQAQPKGNSNAPA